MTMIHDQRGSGRRAAFRLRQVTALQREPNMAQADAAGVANPEQQPREHHREQVWKEIKGMPLINLPTLVEALKSLKGSVNSKEVSELFYQKPPGVKLLGDWGRQMAAEGTHKGTEVKEIFVKHAKYLDQIRYKSLKSPGA